MTSVSRRTLLRATLVGFAATGAGGVAGCLPRDPAGGQAVAQGQRSKAEAAYQDRPNRGQRCGDCAFFRAPNACAIVAGEISPDGWCRFFRPA